MQSLKFKTLKNGHIPTISGRKHQKWKWYAPRMAIKEETKLVLHYGYQ